MLTLVIKYSFFSLNIGLSMKNQIFVEYRILAELWNFTLNIEFLISHIEFSYIWRAIVKCFFTLPLTQFHDD